MLRNFNDETNFQNKSLLTNKQASRIRKPSANGSSDYIKFSKTQLSKMVQLGVFVWVACCTIKVSSNWFICTIKMVRSKLDWYKNEMKIKTLVKN